LFSSGQPSHAPRIVEGEERVRRSVWRPLICDLGRLNAPLSCHVGRKSRRRNAHPAGQEAQNEQRRIHHIRVPHVRCCARKSCFRGAQGGRMPEVPRTTRCTRGFNLPGRTHKNQARARANTSTEARTESQGTREAAGTRERSDIRSVALRVGGARNFLGWARMVSLECRSQGSRRHLAGHHILTRCCSDRSREGIRDWSREGVRCVPACRGLRRLSVLLLDRRFWRGIAQGMGHKQQSNWGGGAPNKWLKPTHHGRPAWPPYCSTPDMQPTREKPRANPNSGDTRPNCALGQCSVLAFWVAGPDLGSLGPLHEPAGTQRVAQE